MSNIDIYLKGLIHCSVCAPKEMPVAELEAAVNTKCPTGIASSWVRSELAFKSGEPNPCACNKDSGRLHYLMNC